MPAVHHFIINSGVQIKMQTLSDLMDGCVHAARPTPHPREPRALEEWVPPRRHTGHSTQGLVSLPGVCGCVRVC